MSLSSKLKEVKASIKNWWLMIVLGVLFIGLGFLVVSKPVESYAALTIFFAVGILLSGIFQIWFAIANRNDIEGWGWQLALGLVEFVIGVILVSNFALSFTMLPFYVGFWLSFRAFALIGFSFELKSYHVMDWGYYLVFGILLGIISWFIIVDPLFGGVTIVTWTALALIVAGVVNIILGFKLRKIKKKFSHD